MAIDDQLQKILNDVMKNPNNSMSSHEVIDIENQGRDKRRHQVVTLYLMDKYAVFHDEYTQTAFSIPELKPLVDYCIKNDWNTNLT